MNTRLFCTDSNDRELQDFFERQKARENVRNTLDVEIDREVNHDRKEELEILRKHI